MRVVIDTNVIVSGLNFPGNERIVLELALRGRFELCLSPFILEEVAGVLGRKFDWDEERLSQALRALSDAGSAAPSEPFVIGALDSEEFPGFLHSMASRSAGHLHPTEDSRYRDNRFEVATIERLFATCPAEDGLRK